MSQELRVRIRNNKVYDQKETPDICYGVFVCNSSGKLHVRKGNIPFCSKYNKPYSGNKTRGRRSGNSMNESISNPSNKYGTTPVYKCVM